MSQSAKGKLLDFLDHRAFDPILEAKPNDFPEKEQDKLRHVQRATADEKDRYHHYESTQKLHRMYRDNLNSRAAKSVDRDLKDLGLPTLSDVRDEFERLAEEVGARS